MLRWLGRIVGLLVSLVIVAIVAILLMPGDRIARVAADQLQNLTGRDVTISGDVTMTIWPTLGASVGGLEVGNADWSEAGPMLTAENAALGIDARALLQGAIRITNIEAQSPTIRLETRADGRASWQFTDASGAAEIATETPPSASADPAPAPRPLSIERLAVTDATLIYDAEGADLVRYDGVDLMLDWPDPSGPAKIDAALRPTAETVTVAAEIGNFGDFLAGNVQPVAVSLAAGPGTARMDGRASLAGEVAGALALDLSNTDAFLRALGLPGADLPDGLGRAVGLTADLTLTTDRLLSLRNLSTKLGRGNTLSGQADVALNDVPQVTATLAAGALDMTGLTGSAEGAAPAGSGGGTGGGSAPAPAAAQGWSDAPIDASALASFNGQIGLSAQSIDFGAIKLGQTRARVTNDASRMVFALSEAQAYSGTLGGQFVVNNRGGLSVGGDLRGAGLQMQNLLDDLVGLDRLTGAAEAQLNFLGSGASMRAIMASLSGNGSFQFGQGTIQGIDLDALMRGGAGGGTTVFDSLGATFDIAGGVLTNDDLLLELRNFEARGRGRVGIAAQDMDYRVTPVALRLNEGQGLAIPVRIRGPWSGLRFEPDLEEAVKLNLEDEIDEVEDRVQRRIEEEIDVEREPGQSVEDAIEKKLEDEIGNRLRNLFD